MQEGTLIKVILTSGIEVVGIVLKQNYSSLPGAINLTCQTPLMEKIYKNKECFPTGETLGNGSERVKYISDRYKLREKRPKTIATIYPKTVKDIILL